MARGFESLTLHIDPLVKWFKTLPFHGSNMGSNPVRVIYVNIIAGWSSLVARWAHNPKVVGSNPAPAIIKLWFVGLLGLGRLPVTQEITGSSPVRTVENLILSVLFLSYIVWLGSSVGRANG